MLNYKYILIYYIFGLLTSSPITNIVIIGNKVTQEQFILDTIQHSIGDTINSELANQDMLDLYETGLFEDVTIYAPGDTTYSIILSEKKYNTFKPSMDKDDITGTSFGGSLIFDNINGENKKFELSALFGDHSLYSLTYLNPRLKQTKDSLQINIYNKQFENIEKEYLINRVALESYINFPINKQQTINLGFNTQYNQTRIQQLYNEYQYDNYSMSMQCLFQQYQNPNQNYSNTLVLYYKGTIFDKYYHNSNEFGLINKYYIPILDNRMKYRLLIKNQIKINFNNIIPIYNKIYIGTENYVRGYKPNPTDNHIEVHNKLKWNNIITSTIQLETLLVKKSNINIEFLLFIDLGLGSNDYKKFPEKNKIRSFGTGIRLHFIKLVNVDLCLGINPYGEKEFHAIVHAKKF